MELKPVPRANVSHLSSTHNPTDWTACVHFRHPSDVGGAYFSFTLLLTIVMGVYAAFDYEAVSSETVEGEKKGFDKVSKGAGAEGQGAKRKKLESTLPFLPNTTRGPAYYRQQ